MQIRTDPLCRLLFDLLFQIHSFYRDETVPKHVHSGLGLFQDDISDQWLVFPILRLHVQEKDFIVNRAESLDLYSNRPAYVSLNRLLGSRF